MINPEMSDLEIVNLSQSVDSIGHIPGTADFSSAGKNTSSGVSYSNDLVFQLPFAINKELELILYNTGAIVIKTIEGVQIVMHKNEIIQNTNLKPVINSGLLKSQISFSITTTFPLI